MKPLRTILALLVLTLATPVSAAHAASPGWIRLAHLSPDAPKVDVYLAPFRGGEQVALRGVGYGDVSDYRRLEPGRYTVSMRPAGASAANPAVVSTRVDVGAGQAYTVAGMGLLKNLRLDVLRDQLQLPASGQARVRVIQASSRAARADVAIADTPTGPLDFATTSRYLDVPAGQVPITVRAQTGTDTNQQVALRAGAVYSLAVLDTRGTDLRIVTLLDAAGPGRTPAGSIKAGHGGAAKDPAVPAHPSAGVGVLLTAGLVAAATLLIRRTPRAPRG